MSQADFFNFLRYASVLCAVMAFVSALQHSKRGARAYIMAAAFLLMGSAMYSVTLQAPTFVVVLLGVLVFLSLAAEAAFRLAKERPTK